MKLPEDNENSSGLSPTVITTIIAVTLFVAVILIGVLVMNETSRPKPQNNNTQGSSPSNEAQGAGAGDQRQEGTEKMEQQPDKPDNGKLQTGGKLTPDDFDFWDMYPPETKESTQPSREEPVKETAAADPAEDGKHTLVKGADGKEEWVLISPYLPKHNYDFTKLASQSNLMKYYEEGKQVSYVGADISKYQDYVDFVKLKKAGIDFVMLRVGARGYGSGQLALDEYFADNIKRATDAGLEIGVYFYSQAVTKEEAVEEANMVLENVKDFKITYPVAYDMEYIENDSARVEQLSKSEKTDNAKAFLDTVKAAGYTPMIYGNKEWLIKRYDFSKLTAYDVWLAQYEDVPDYPYKFSMWQYTVSATIDGIAGYANLNVSFIDYSNK